MAASTRTATIFRTVTVCALLVLGQLAFAIQDDSSTLLEFAYVSLRTLVAILFGAAKKRPPRRDATRRTAK